MKTNVVHTHISTRELHQFQDYAVHRQSTFTDQTQCRPVFLASPSVDLCMEHCNRFEKPSLISAATSNQNNQYQLTSDFNCLHCQQQFEPVIVKLTCSICCTTSCKTNPQQIKAAEFDCRELFYCSELFYSCILILSLFC